MWKVYVTDNKDAEHLIVVRAKGEADALDKGKTFFRRLAPRGVWAVSARAERE
jgi:hypothetical protein